MNVLNAEEELGWMASNRPCLGTPITSSGLVRRKLDLDRGAAHAPFHDPEPSVAIIVPVREDWR
jgi:hypothetical protein